MFCIQPLISLPGKDINFITGSCVDDAYNFVIKNPLGMPTLGDKNNVANDNETLWEFYMVLLGSTENPEEIAESIYSVYPDLYSPDNFTRTLAATKSCTEWWFASASNWEAHRHHRSVPTRKEILLGEAV